MEWSTHTYEKAEHTTENVYVMKMATVRMCPETMDKWQAGKKVLESGTEKFFGNNNKHLKNVANITLFVRDKPHDKIYAKRSISDENSTQLSNKFVSGEGKVRVCN